MALKLLIVEDDESQIRLYENSIERWNEENPLIEHYAAQDKELAKQYLSSFDYDAAIVDLKFPGDGPEEASGNEVLEGIKDKLRVPVYVVSGSPQDLDASFEDHPFIEKYQRGIKNEELFKKIYSRFSTGVTNILGRKGKFEEALNKVFWDHLSHAISHWETIDLPPEDKEKQLLRYTLNHIMEMLASNDDGVDDKFDSAEVYIKPPVHEKVSPGMLLEHEGCLYVVITPACDISQQNAEFYQLIRLQKLDEISEIKSRGKSNSRAKIIRNFVENKKGRFHFLPSFDDVPNAVLDFQNILVEKTDKVEAEFERKCILSAPFFKDIVNRFSSYYARQGSPDFNTEDLVVSINGSLHENPIEARSS